LKTINPILHERLMDFLREDIGMGDVTTEAIVPVEAEVQAQIIVKEPAVIAGLYETSILFEMVDVSFQARVEDGAEGSQYSNEDEWNSNLDEKIRQDDSGGWS